MKLTKEECKQALKDIWYIAMTTDYVNKYDFKNGKHVANSKYQKEKALLLQLIEEHFKFIELLEKHELQDLSIKELDAWFDRSLWYVNKVNELSNKLVELSRYVKSKDERIDYLTSNPPLNFEELKEDMVVWDNKRKIFIKIFDIATLEENCFSFEVFGWNVPIYDEKFEENRFYLKGSES